jgi:heptosyltransferase-2
MAAYSNYSRKARIFAFLLDLISWPVRLFSKKDFPEKIENILMVRPDHLGDLMMNIDAMYSLKQKFPRARLILITPSWNLPIARKLEFIDEVLPVELKWYCFNRENHMPLTRLMGLIRLLRKEQIDLFIDFRGDFRLVLLFGFLTGAKIRRGFLNLGGRHFLNNHAFFDRNIHFVQQNFELISPFTRAIHHFNIRLNRSEEQKADEILKHHGLKAGSFVIIHPSVAAYWKVKRWPLPHFITVARHIMSTYKRDIVICSGPAEMDTGNSMARHIPDSINLSGHLSLFEFASILKRAMLLISNDSAPMHLGVHFNIPLIAIFGPTDFRRSGPYPLSERQLACEGRPGLKRPLFGVRFLEKDYFPGPAQVINRVDKLINSLTGQSPDHQ